MAGVAESEQPTGGGPIATKKHQDEETQGLKKVTDYVEEKENSAELGQVRCTQAHVLMIIFRECCVPSGCVYY